MYNGISDDILNQTEGYLEGYLKGIQDGQEKLEKQKTILEKLRDRDDFYNFIKDNCGSFYFTFYKRLLGEIEPQYLIRFLYLCTYLDYNDRLVRKSGNRYVCISKNDLQSILNLGKTETYKTRNILVEKELIYLVDDIVYINPNYCKKGDIVKNKRVEKVRVFEDGLRELYEKSTQSEHKKLSLLFEILPYINLRWNVVCKDTTEENLENIKPYTIRELMTLLKHTNITRFKRSLLGLTICGQPVIMINSVKNMEFVTINPMIYYKGTNMEELNYLLGLFSINNTNR